LLIGIRGGQQPAAQAAVIDVVCGGKPQHPASRPGQPGGEHDPLQESVRAGKSDGG
jgi:hypothetical protein